MLYGYRHCTHKNRWIYREIEGDVETRTFQLMKQIDHCLKENTKK